MAKQKRPPSYDVLLKLDAVKFAEGKSREGAAREFGVDPKPVCEWCSQKTRLIELAEIGGTRRIGARRKLFDEKMEDLFERVTELHHQNLHVSRGMIAMKVKERGDTGDFRASCGWLQCMRHSACT